MLDSSKSPKSIVITIDGPAGAGKSTVARLLAQQLQFEFLDTGAFYRCMTLAVLRQGISLTDTERIRALAKSIQIEQDAEYVYLNGEDVSKEIRMPKVAAAIGLVADDTVVRSVLTSLQRTWAQGKNVVSEGRDQGTEVFPDSPCKIFLIASADERARRRQRELATRGIEMSYESVLAQQEKRDLEDASRPIGRLRKAEDALEVCTDGLSLPDVCQQLLNVICDRLSLDPAQLPMSAGTDQTSESKR